MLVARRSVALSVTLLAVLGLAATSQAENQQYQGSLLIESFGNDDLTAYPGIFSVFGMPQGIQCNPGQPRCPLGSTPTGMEAGLTVFKALGNGCKPITFFGVTQHPAKGATATTGTAEGPKNVHYRNPAFFSAGGAPNATSCSATQTAGGKAAKMFLTTNSPLRGKGMKGAPLTGEQIVTLTTMTGPAGFILKKAPLTPVKTPGPTGFGLRRTTSGEFNNIPPYLYSYTYATLRNDAGSFFEGGGPGAFDQKYYEGAVAEARVVVKAGPNKFGGVMRLLGKITTRVCYYTNNTACLLGGNNWRYESVGATAYTVGGMVTKGYRATYMGMYFNTNNSLPAIVTAKGYRFPWTTGSVTVRAYDTPHNTVERRHGSDNRTALGKGTIQLVTPVLTRWIQTGASDQYTGGIGVLRLRFVPEPGKWMLLAAGLAMLGILYRTQGR